MTMPLDPFGGPSASQIMSSAGKVKFGVGFVGTSAPDLVLGRIVFVPMMYPSISLGGNDFRRQSGILAADIDKLAVSIRSFRVPLTRSRDQVMIPSIATNFAVEGRPRWQPLAEGTVENRNGSTNPILVKTGKLKRTALQKNMWKYESSGRSGTSVDFISFDGDALLRRVPYGVFNQLGAFRFSSKSGLTIGGVETPRWELPARPFVTMRPEDQVLIHSIFYQWLVERTDYYYYGFGNKPGRR